MTSTEELTRWIETHCPKEIPGSTFVYSGGTLQAISDPAFQSWFDAFLERGFTVPDWPVEYGGAGFDKQQMATLYFVSVDGDRVYHSLDSAFEARLPKYK